MNFSYFYRQIKKTVIWKRHGYRVLPRNCFFYLPEKIGKIHTKYFYVFFGIYDAHVLNIDARICIIQIVCVLYMLSNVLNVLEKLLRILTWCELCTEKPLHEPNRNEIR